MMGAALVNPSLVELSPSSFDRIAMSGPPEAEAGTARHETVRVLVQSPLGPHMELYVNPDDNVYLLKCRIFRIRGIPVSQQQITHNMVELPNSSSLRSHSIAEGSVLGLIVSLKNGLASDCGRNVSTLDHIQWTDLKRYLETNRDDPMEWLHAGCRGLLIDEEENDSIGRFLFDAPQTMFLPGIPLTEEDCVTKCKMIDVQSRMRELTIKRYEKNYTTCRVSDPFYPTESCPCGEGDHCESLYSGVLDYYRRPISKITYESTIRKMPNKHYNKLKHAHLESISSDFNKCFAGGTDDAMESGKDDVAATEDEIFKGGASKESKDTRGFLPPIDSKIKEKAKRIAMGKSERVRCSVCRKRLSISTIHMCQCGGAFCAPHRYSEVHNCKHDYSKEWQAQLQRANPPAYSLPKLPKI